MIGLWWLPSESDEAENYRLPDHNVPGEFADSGGSPWTLTTIGSLGSAERHVLLSAVGGSPAEEDVIWGTDSGGRSLSLFDTVRFSTNFQSANPKGGTEQWSVLWYTSGSNLWVGPSTMIDLISVRFDILEDWAVDDDGSTHSFEVKADSLSFPTQTSFSASMDGATLTLKSGHVVEPVSGSYKVCRFAKFDISDLVPLDRVSSKWIAPLSLLLDLLGRTMVRVVSITVRPEGHRWPLDLHVNLYHQSTKEREPRQPPGMLATRVSLAQANLDFATLMKNFFQLYDSDRHRLALRYLTQSQTRFFDTTVDSELLGVCKALEQYHMEVIGGTTMPKDAYRRVVSAAVKASPSDWQQWINERLSGSNYKSLRTRLNDVVERAGDTGKRIQEVWPDFCRDVVCYRNLSVHGGRSARENLGSQFLVASTGVRWLLRHVYLMELGMSDADTGRLIQENPVFEQRMRLIGSTTAH